ncbi:MAG: flavin reductase [Thermofilaceae archaeon]
MTKLDFKEAFSALPQPLTIVTAGDPNKPGKRGGMTAAWVSWISVNPPLLMVAMFAVNIVGKSLESAAYGVFGSVSG